MKVATNAEDYHAAMARYMAGILTESTNGGDKFAGLKKQLEICCVPINSKDATAERLHQEGFDDWLRIEKMPSYFEVEDRPGYEAFVQGYLTYFEEYCITKEEKEMKNYIVYFDWSKTDPGKNDLVIYLNPLERRIKSYDDYPTPEIEPKEEKILLEKESGFVKVLVNRSPFPPPPSMTDPQPPPPPPPPKTGR